MIKLSDVIMPAFRESWANHDNYTYNVEKGGRDTGKTSLHALRMVYNRMKTKTSGLCVRRYSNTLADSTFQDILWAIKRLDVERYWSWRMSPLSFRYKPTGTVILFRGADQADRIKGIKAEWPFKDCMFDELVEFRNEDDFDTIINSILRAEMGFKYSFFISYNPPKRKKHWCNLKFEARTPPPDTHIHHSTVYDNIYASKQMIERANALKLVDNLKWRWIYMGEPIGGGMIPFDNLVFRHITDEEIQTFDNIWAGVDWGYKINLLAYIRLHFDSTRRRLYMMNEFGGLKISNEKLVKHVLEKNFMERCTADSASPKDIACCRDLGMNIIGAKKGPGSVETGERWLDSLEEIVIDDQRTPLCAKQFENIDYAVSSTGEQLARLEDNENDFIDATRYAVEHLILGRKQIY